MYRYIYMYIYIFTQLVHPPWLGYLPWRSGVFLCFWRPPGQVTHCDANVDGTVCWGTVKNAARGTWMARGLHRKLHQNGRWKDKCHRYHPYFLGDWTFDDLCWDVWLRHFLTRFDQVGTIVSGCGALAMATVKNCLKGFLDTIWWGSDYMLSHLPSNNPFITITPLEN